METGRTKIGEESEFFQGNKFIPKRLGDKILQESSIKTLEGSSRMYIYNEGYYKENAKEKIKAACVKALGEQYLQKHFSETVSYIQGCSYTSPDAASNGWLNLKNGLLQPITREFKEHTPEVFSIIQNPVEYDPDADCPTWKEKLEEKVDQKTVTVLQEMFGYCYLPGQKYQVGFLLYGPQRSMKSTSLNALESIIGKENTTSFSLQYLSENQFAPAYLYGKPLNICADLTSKALKNTGTFMSITGADKISAGKKREHMLSFYPDTKLIFSCNEIPPTENKNLAFYRRWILLNFDKQTAEDRIDHSLLQKLEAELSGILNWSLEGLDRLLKNDGLSYWLSPREVKDLYEKNSDSIQSFIYNCINTEDDEGTLKKREVYKAYKEYCSKERVRLENQIKFGRLFSNLTGCGNCQTNKIPAYRGVSWKEGPKQGGLNDDY